jgi:hypothetical protein
MLPQLNLQALQQQYRQQAQQQLRAQWPPPQQQQQQQQGLVGCLAACGVLPVLWLAPQGSCSAVSSLP